MAYCLSSFLPAVLLLVSISSGKKLYVNLCQDKTITSGNDTLRLYVRPSIRSLITNASVTCSCSVNLFSASNKVNVGFSRDTKSVSGCNEENYDEVTLFVNDATGATEYIHSLQDEELSDDNKESYENIASITFQVTMHSICGFNYSIWLEKYYQTVNVTCNYSQATISPTARRPISDNIIPTSRTSTKVSPTSRTSTKVSRTSRTSTKVSRTSRRSSTVSPTALKPTPASKNDTSTAYSSKESSSADSVPTPIGLIVGVVVGVGSGLLLLGAIILAVFIIRRRRQKPQPLTYANHNASIDNSYEPPASGVPISYEDTSNSNQLQPSAPYDNQTAATDSLTTETNQSYYSVQGIDNSAFPPNFAEYNSGRATSEEVDRFAQETHSVDDTDIIVIDNDLYEK